MKLGKPRWVDVTVAPGSKLPPKRTGHTIVTHGDQIYVYVCPSWRAHLETEFARAALAERTDNSTTTILGALILRLVYGQSCPASDTFQFRAKDMLPRSSTTSCTYLVDAALTAKILRISLHSNYLVRILLRSGQGHG